MHGMDLIHNRPTTRKEVLDRRAVASQSQLREEAKDRGDLFKLKDLKSYYTAGNWIMHVLTEQFKLWSSINFWEYFNLSTSSIPVVQLMLRGFDGVLARIHVNLSLFKSKIIMHNIIYMPELLIQSIRKGTKQIDLLE